MALPVIRDRQLPEFKANLRDSIMQIISLVVIGKNFKNFRPGRKFFSNSTNGDHWAHSNTLAYAARPLDKSLSSTYKLILDIMEKIPLILL